MYPNPIKRRTEYKIINNSWEFSFDNEKWQPINVPFCPQSRLSGIGYTDFIRKCFYKRTFKHTKCPGRTVLHFGAVDYRAVVSLNGNYVGTHTGGFTSFEFDITSYLRDGENKIGITVYDENENLAFGKQSYKKNSFGCFYTRTTGIWQSVWLEYTPAKYIKEFYFYPDPETCAVEVELLTSHSGRYELEVWFEKKKVGSAKGEVDYKTRVRIPLSEKHLWELGKGNLYNVILRFEEDEIHSYFGLRTVGYEGYKFLLNGKETFQKLVLDQGFYPDGLYTAPSEEALKKDVELSVRLGFNGIRLHQKVFDPRYLYFCDKAGCMVWGEFPSWGIDYSNLNGLGQFLAEWQETLQRDFNHPSVVLWCPLNEVWGDWKDPKKKPDLRFVESVYKFTKQFDVTRPCVDVSGGFHGKNTDLYDFHCYEPLESLKKYLDRWENEGILDVPLLSSKGLTTDYRAGQPVHLSECGGIAFGRGHTGEREIGTVNEVAVGSERAWGYGKSETDGDSFVERYRALTELLFRYKNLSGYCYTQLYDIEQEENGFYRYDRSDKLTEAQKDRIKKIQTGKRNR